MEAGPSDVTDSANKSGQDPAAAATTTPSSQHSNKDDTSSISPLYPTQFTLGSASVGTLGLRGATGKGKVWRMVQEDAEALHWHGVRLQKLVGTGPVSTVYEAEDLTRSDERGQVLKVAARVMDWSQVQGIYQRSVYPKLISMYEKMPDHPNLVKLIQRIVDGPVTYLLQEWCALGSLTEAVGPSGCLSRGLTEDTARGIVKGVCQGLLFLQSLELPHGRLTSQNVLLDRNMEVKLSDYGYPASFCGHCYEDDMHLRYRAPEILRGKTYTAYAGDIWSLGVVVYFMLHSALPYTAAEVAGSSQLINMPPLQCKKSLSYLGVMFLKRLLTFNAWMRPVLFQITSDPWLNVPPKQYPLRHTGCYKDHLRYLARLL